MKKHPSVLRIVPKATAAYVRYKCKRCSWKEVTEIFFGFLRYLSHLEQLIEDFWDSGSDKLYGWYLRKKSDSDVIVSAAPYFLISSVCNRLGVKCIATDFDTEKGVIRGKECSGEEKAERYLSEYGNIPIDEFYSDSFNDRPLARLAAKAFMVDKGNISVWNTEKTEYARGIER